MVKRFDEELQEEVEIRIKNPLGFCGLCGNPMHYPKKIKVIYACQECYRCRLEDLLVLDKEYRKLEDGNNTNNKLPTLRTEKENDPS